MPHIDRITLNPEIMGGALYPWDAHQRRNVLGLLAAGHSREEILKAYPYLEEEDISQALAYGAWRVEERETPKFSG